MNIAEQAADWLLTLKTDPRRQAEFGAWLRESPRHVEEFLLVTATYRSLDTALPAAPVDAEGLRASLAGDVARIPLPHRPYGRRQSSGPRRRALIGGALAAGIAGAAAWMLYIGAFAGERYSTAIGENRSIELEDHSMMHLNTRSQARVRYSAGGRDIQLTAGEALFEVARDATRPFRVEVNGTTVQAIGTAFNIYCRACSGTGPTTVSVVEGMVRIFRDGEAGATNIPAGMAVHIGADGAISALTAANLTQATAWRQGRLLFKDDALPAVAEEFNRYNRSLRIRVEGAAQNRKLTGIFDARDSESLLLFLTRVPGLEVTRDGQEAVVK